jgi:homoserine kinase
MNHPLAGRRVVVEVPATIANLGAGFDCLGLAIDLALHVSIEAAAEDPAMRLDLRGEDAGEVTADRANPFVAALDAGFMDGGRGDLAGLDWSIEMINTIPLARGLGSSAAAAVAGALAARALLGVPASNEDVMGIATRLEGHVDNVAPAVLGGFVAAFAGDDGIASYRFDTPESLHVVLFVPERRLATAAMRDVLPTTVPRADALANLARVAAGVAGIASGDWDVLRFLTADRLHEPYRAASYPEMPALIEAARSAGAVGACLAGAGSSVAAFALGATPAELEHIGDSMATAAAEAGLPGRIRVVGATNGGGRVTSVT